MKGMRKLIEMVMSLIVVAATYAVMHIIFISDLFNFTEKMPAYVPAALSVFTGFIFYFIASTTTANILMKRMTQTEERLTRMNVKELSFSVLGCFVGLVIAILQAATQVHEQTLSFVPKALTIGVLLLLWASHPGSDVVTACCAGCSVSPHPPAHRLPCLSAAGLPCCTSAPKAFP